MSGENILESRTIRQQFIGSHIKYNLRQCQMLQAIEPFLINYEQETNNQNNASFFCLAVVSDNWTAVGWDFKRNQINVYAPGQIEQNKENKWAVHTAVVRKLHEALKSCVTAFFDGWPVDAWNWPLVFIDPYPRHAQFTQRLFTLRYYHILNIQAD